MIRSTFRLLTIIAFTMGATQTQAQSLGSAEAFGVLGASTVTNTGASIIQGSVGVSPGSAITGFPPGQVINGGIHAADAVATQAHADYAAAYTAFAGLPYPPANDLTGTDMGGLTLIPGVYHYDTEATIGGILTFDAQNNPNARFVIEIGTTLITANVASAVLINGADARNIYFQVGTSATLGSGSTFIGNILAYASITAVGGVNMTGRLMALTGAVTLDSNIVQSPGLTPTQLLNISTRLKVETGENVAIVGFIITGNAPKKVMVRGIGPSLSASRITNALANPTLELHGANGANGGLITGLIASNDDWQDTQKVEIQNSNLAPTNDFESAIIATLTPGGYTAILADKTGTTGVGLVEVYDLDVTADSQLGNLSGRGFVQTGDDVMIGGFMLGNGTADGRVLVRAIGPSLTSLGVTQTLVDPTLALHNADGVLFASNDNWRDDPAQTAEIIGTGIPPQDDLESAIVATLPPGPCTAIVRGKNGGAGVGLAEIYLLNLK